jgi:hypothetical protein
MPITLTLKFAFSQTVVLTVSYSTGAGGTYEPPTGAKTVIGASVTGATTWGTADGNGIAVGVA